MKTADNNLVFLSLGSNISPRKHHISNSLQLLKEHFPVRFCVSSLDQTDPFQGLNQQAYINCAVQCWTDIKPLEMLDTISRIEIAVGRKRRGVKWESRIIDIDILLWGNQVIEHPRLTIPHYDLNNRDFFLIPLLELDKTLIHPYNGDLLINELQKIPPRLLTHPIVVEQDAKCAFH